MALPLDGLLIGIKLIRRAGSLSASAGRNTALNFSDAFTASYDSATETISIGVDPAEVASGIGEVSNTADGLAPSVGASGLALVSTGTGSYWSKQSDTAVLAPRQAAASGFAADSEGVYEQSSTTDAVLYLPVGGTSGRYNDPFVFRVQGASGHAALPGTMPRVELQRKVITLGDVEPASWTTVTTGTDASATVAAYEKVHTISVAMDPYDFDTDSMWRLAVFGEASTNATTGLRILEAVTSVFGARYV